MQTLGQHPPPLILVPRLRQGKTTFEPDGQIADALPIGGHMRIEMLATD